MLDDTDEKILKHILLANPISKINIYYHNEEAQERLMNKINSIIGEEEVMEKVIFTYQHDLKRGILIPQEEMQLINAWFSFDFEWWIRHVKGGRMEKVGLNITPKEFKQLSKWSENIYKTAVVISYFVAN